MSIGMWVLCILKLILPILLFVENLRSNLEFKKKIEEHNRKVIMKYNCGRDLNDVWIKPKDFLKSGEDGNRLCDFTNGIKFIDYADAYGLKNVQDK